MKCSEDSDNAKAYFRRAVAKHQIGNYEEAKTDFEEAKRCDPSITKEVEKEETKLEAKIRAAEAKQRREMRSFFDR